MAEEVAQNKEQPLAGAVLCCTSVLPELRTQIAATATQMGAIHTFDLTSQVTHLIVGETNTPKYKYVAKERLDIKVLRPEWVEAVRASWVSGEDTDLRALEEEYRYPTFGGLAICLTGFEDLDFRTRLQNLVATNGAEFRRDLTKTVTHLIARVPKGDKYDFAKRWRLKVVSLKWFEDSLERGMVLEESLYDPCLPAENQGFGAWNRVAPTVIEKRPKPSAGSQRPRKLRRVASAKLGDQTEGIWTDIVRNDANAATADQVDNAAPGLRVAYSEPNRPPILQVEKSFASETTFFDRPQSTTQETELLTLRTEDEQPRGIWHASRFFIHGFTRNQTEILKSPLLAQEATIVSSLKELLTQDDGSVNSYVLVPFNLPRSQIPSIDDDEDLEVDVVTDMWIEKCLFFKTFVPPESHITSTPFPKFPIPAFQGITICSTGFTGIDLLHLSKLVKLMGATYDEYLTRKASVLVCLDMNPSPEKLMHAYEWKIPAVIADWLWISVQTGEQKPFKPYIIPYRRSVNEPVHKPRDAEMSDNKGRQSRTLFKKFPPATETQRDILKVKNGGEMFKSESSSNEECSAESPRKVACLPPESEAQQDISAPAIPDTINPPHPQPAKSSVPAPLEIAIGDLLRQKRTGLKGVNAVDRDTAPQRPRRLLGRALSNSSTLGTGINTFQQHQRQLSRASSIDTMNEDGYGVALEGLDSQSSRANSRSASFVGGGGTRTGAANNNNTELRQLSDNPLDIFNADPMFAEYAGRESPRDAGGPEDDEAPQMTQLGYEDPDAIAMREQIQRHAESMKECDDGQDHDTSALAEKRKSETSHKLVIGTLQENEAAGWASRRRTRSAKKKDGKERKS